MIIYIHNSFDRRNEKTDELIFAAVSRFASEKGIALPEDISVRRDKNGKPFLVPDEKIFFSVSHSGNIWAAAADTKNVGFDIEKMHEVNYTAIAKRFFTIDEQRYVDTNGIEGFFTIWTLKEAYMKYTGKGFSEGLNSFSTVYLTQISHTINGIACSPVAVAEGFASAFAGGCGYVEKIESL